LAQTLKGKKRKGVFSLRKFYKKERFPPNSPQGKGNRDPPKNLGNNKKKVSLGNGNQRKLRRNWVNNPKN